jgi:hypothetical protein
LRRSQLQLSWLEVLLVSETEASWLGGMGGIDMAWKGVKKRRGSEKLEFGALLAS